jgi:type II secretory pathway pseudopilin PulG
VPRGFTFIEMVVVILALMLIAALIMPNMVAIHRSREQADVEASILRASAEARNEARRSQRPVSIRLEDGSLILERISEEEDPEQVKRVSLGEELRAERALRGEEPVDPDNWRWTVYPDGSAETGGIEFSQGDDRKSLLIAADGTARWVRGALSETIRERWPAGEIEQRG